MQQAKNLLDALTTPGILPPPERGALLAWATTFYPFQREWLFDASRYAFCVKSRQIGMSHTTSAATVCWGSFLGETSTIISIGQREADEVLEKAERHAKVLVELGSSWARARRKGEALLFANGGRVLALPASSGGRGFTGNVFLDEYAYVDNPEGIWDAASAVTMHGYRMRVASTPNGVGNPFHALVTEPERSDGWTPHHFPIARARAEGMKLDDKALWAMAKGDPRIYAQLFECAFLDGAEQYIPTQKITDAVRKDFDPRLSGERFAGMDIGLTNDLSVLVVVEQDDHGVAHVVDMVECKRTDWEDQQAMVMQSAAYWGWKRLCVDATGLGMVPTELLQKKLGKMRVEPYPFSSASKEALATLLYQAFHDNMVRMLRDTALIKDLCSLRRIVTASGAIRYEAPRTDQGHGDRAWALALALEACSRKPTRAAAHGAGDFTS